MKKYLTVHGHFYQPPRENPWTEAIEYQPSAHPYHDWNERITHECYSPNAFSRILDAGNRIVDIVNNYQSISFNFGPTLMSWLERHASEVYQRILQADQESLSRFNGHGSAIAQCYNHIIMPLANERDQHTQIRWGVADFRYRFKRDPESIWLPETAINQTTLNILTEYPFIKYIILSPYQAQRVRPLGDPNAAWQSVEVGDIDTRQPYRCFARDANGNPIKERYIDIFFYHGDLARGISFEHLLQNAGHLAERIEHAYGRGDGDKLVSVATDGETYGHHQKYGDMGLAYLLHVEAQLRHIIPTTFGAYLETHPPTHEVELKPGPGGEGTAWSCAHGVGRWYRDCGCKTGGDYRWNQAWRQPLRDALNWLRDRLAEITEETGAALFHDVWEARNGYIQVILDRSDPSRNRFLETYARSGLSRREVQQALKVMEIQRQSQLMFTSCGWFFTEISGIETVQILKYAARGIQLAESLVPGLNLEDTFLSYLRQAKSNIPEHRDGEWIYNHFVKPSVVDFDKVANHYAMCSMFNTFNHVEQENEQKKIFIYFVNETDQQLFNTEDVQCIVGKVNIKSEITLEEEAFAFALINRHHGEKLHCHVRKLKDSFWDYEQAKARLQALLQSNDDVDLKEETQRIWGGKIFSLIDMFYDERRRVAETLIQSELQDLSKAYRTMYEKYMGLNLTIARLDVPLPEAITIPAKITLGNILYEELTRLESVVDINAYRKAMEAARAAQRLNISLNGDAAVNLFLNHLEKYLLRLYLNFNKENARRVVTLIELADHLKLDLPQSRIQNQLFKILKLRVLPAIEKIVKETADKNLYDVVNDTLRMAYRFNFNIKIYKDRLRPFEEKISQDPNYWP